jgi:hypothetical protein
MANVKISNLPAESDVNNIIGFAGYNAAGTCKISGADLINTLPSSTPPLSDVLTAGNIVQDQVINIQTTSDIRNTRFDKNGISQSNFAADIILSQIAAGRVFLSTNNNDIVLQALGTGQVVFNTPEIALQSGDVLDSTSSAGSTGQVLSSLGAGNGTEWVAAGGPTPGIVDVLNAGFTANTGQVIALTTGGTVTTYAQTNIQCGGSFSITQGTNDLLTLGSAVSAATLAGGAGAVQVGDTGNNLLISTNSSDKIQLSCNGTGEVEFYLGLNNTSPAIGDVLTAKSTAGAVEWTTPSGPTNSLTPSNTTDLDMFNDGVVRLWWDVSASDIELEITNQGGGSGSTSSVYHASYTNFDGTSTTTSTTDFNAQNATTIGTLDFNFSTDEVMILRLWTPDASLQPGFGYYEVTFTKSSSLYTGVPILCSVRKSSF